MRVPLEAAALAGMVTFVAGCAEAPPDAGANPIPEDPNHIQLPTPFPSPTAVLFSPSPTRTPNIEATVQAAVQATMAAKPPATETPKPAPKDQTLEPGWMEYKSDNPDMPIRVGYAPGWKQDNGMFSLFTRLPQEGKDFYGFEAILKFNNNQKRDFANFSSSIQIINKKRPQWINLEDAAKQELTKTRNDSSLQSASDLSSLAFQIDGQPGLWFWYVTREAKLGMEAYDSSSKEFMEASRRQQVAPPNFPPGTEKKVIVIKGDFIYAITLTTIKPDTASEMTIFDKFLKTIKFFR